MTFGIQMDHSTWLSMSSYLEIVDGKLCPFWFALSAGLTKAINSFNDSAISHSVVGIYISHVEDFSRDNVGSPFHDRTVVIHTQKFIVT